MLILRQFLVDSRGVVKLNDFNRCRFMPNNTMTGKPCQVTIPSAPGGARAPEEYKSERLTEKLDIFSTGHVLYAILTGRKPWDDLWGSQVKKLVKEGKKPPIVDKKYLQLGTSDAALANLIDLAYEFDPQDRPSASKLVAELERLDCSVRSSSRSGRLRTSSRSNCKSRQVWSFSPLFTSIGTSILGCVGNEGPQSLDGAVTYVDIE